MTGQVLADLGLHRHPHPMGIGELIVADATGLTDVPGVWVAGNVADLVAGVAAAAAAAINADLVAEEHRTRRGRPPRPALARAAAGAETCGRKTTRHGFSATGWRGSPGAGLGHPARTGQSGSIRSP